MLLNLGLDCMMDLLTDLTKNPIMQPHLSWDEQTNTKDHHRTALPELRQAYPSTASTL